MVGGVDGGVFSGGGVVGGGGVSGDDGGDGSIVINRGGVTLKELTVFRRLPEPFRLDDIVEGDAIFAEKAAVHHEHFPVETMTKG